MLEHAFTGLDVEQVFVRATYYYSNWTGYCNLAREKGILPTFFPVDLKIPMISPADVGAFVADVLAKKREPQAVMEIAGPRSYSAGDIAGELQRIFDRPVTAVRIPRNEWQSTLERAGFSPSGATGLALMTDAVLSGNTEAEGEVQFTHTSFSDYIRQVITE